MHRHDKAMCKTHCDGNLHIGCDYMLLVSVVAMKPWFQDLHKMLWPAACSKHITIRRMCIFIKPHVMQCI